MADIKVAKRGNGDFPDVYFPLRVSEVIDTFNKEAFLKLIHSEDRPRRYLFQGLRGTGKTTIGRVFSLWLNCTNLKEDEACLECANCKSILKGSPDIMDINVADSRNIDDSRDIIEAARYNPMTLKYKVFILDEVQQMNSLAQNALLKAMEKKYKRIIWVLCTTEPTKIIKTLRDRCTAKFVFHGASEDQKIDLMTAVLTNEKFKYNLDDIDKIADSVDNSVRNILATLQNYIAGIVSPKLIEENQNWVKEIANIIMKGHINFMPKLKEVPQLGKDKDVEGFRLGIAGYIRACAINSSSDRDRALQFIQALDDLTYAYYAPDPLNRLVTQLFKASSRFR